MEKKFELAAEQLNLCENDFEKTQKKLQLAEDKVNAWNESEVRKELRELKKQLREVKNEKIELKSKLEAVEEERKRKEIIQERKLFKVFCCFFIIVALILLLKTFQPSFYIQISRILMEARILGVLFYHFECYYLVIILFFPYELCS